MDEREKGREILQIKILEGGIEGVDPESLTIEGQTKDFVKARLDEMLNRDGIRYVNGKLVHRDVMSPTPFEKVTQQEVLARARVSDADSGMEFTDTDDGTSIPPDTPLED